MIDKKALNERLKKLYPDENLIFISYKNMKSPAEVQCNNCKNIYQMQRAENFFRKKKYFCKKCCDTSSWELQKENFLKWLSNQDDFELVDDLSKIHNSQEHIKCKCTKCGLIQENKRVYDYYNGKQCFCVSKGTKKPHVVLEKELEEQGYELLEEYQNTDIPTMVRRISCNHTFRVRIADILKDKYYCPLCNNSKGELAIINFLNNNNIKYIRQYSITTYKTCFIDFFILSLNLFIEYNGIQHYKPIKFFGGEEAFNEQTKRDQSVREYSINNNKKLLEISYQDFENIDEILKEAIRDESISWVR